MRRPQPIDPPRLYAPAAGWSQVVVVGSLVFISGQVAWDEHGGVVGRGSIVEQAEKAFDNLRRALEAGGSTLDRLIKVTVFLTSAEHIAGFRRVRDAVLGGVRPASTLVVVQALADPELLVEIEAIAIAA